MCYILRMTKTMTLRDANQSFSHCIRAVESGEDFVITRNGKPVARLTPVSNARVLTEQQKQALAHFRQVAREGWPLRSGPLDRDALHER
ncbi:type II toxin-antitoxin system Phd/YefM family antitoxin [Rhodopila sp.]|uniref:type II toxin-antitoxin system Phd/YefM family antitoxin n=1 Tax=Rhodopila sp. TaxID=2480087 RepID=UPI003D14E8A7